MYYLLAAAATFNLTCTGTMESKTIFGEETEPYSYTYRMDLDAQKWCDGECKALFPIHAIHPTEIELQYDKSSSPSEEKLTANSIDRETGRQSILATSKNPRDPRSILIIKWEGMCEKSDFTGFPKFETKF